MARNFDPVVEEVLNVLTDVYGIPQSAVAFGGGGKGQTAYVEGYRGVGVIEGKGTSRLAAVEDLARKVAMVDDPDDEPEGDFEGMTEGEAERCVAECMTSQSDYCECKCDGANHGALAGRRGRLVVRLGVKTCACGCGEPTQRRFVPGHDARYHTAQAAKAAGMTPDAYREHLKVERNKRAAERRRAKRAAIKAGAAKVAAAAAAGTLVTGSKPVAEPVSPKGDDLPF